MPSALPGQGERGRLARQRAGEQPSTSEHAKVINHRRRLRLAEGDCRGDIGRRCREHVGANHHCVLRHGAPWTVSSAA
jgi:hypothetical protein